MNINNYFQSNNKLSKIILILSVVVVALAIFQSGMFIGYRQATFSNRWDSRYERGLNDPKSPFAPFMMMEGGVNPHGAFGQIVSKNLPKLLVKGPRNAEEIVVLDNNTSIRKLRNIASTSDLTIGKEIIVIGEPNDEGEIRAKLIRIMPDNSSSSPSYVPMQNMQKINNQYR